MSFLFPANPADGDIVVQPQPDGRLIKGTYNEADNTWAVGELPQEPGIPGPEGPRGPIGPQGPPGQGVQISGVVDTLDNLPPPENHYLQFWVVDDTNTLYYSDGYQWYNLGSPIRGPQGTAGTDGTDGTDGQDGAPGKGWTSTTIIDETDQNPPNYQIRFNSDDGLGFVTDNILGPQGETGSLQVASATRLGGIKIGRGLNILPDGTAQAGETNVDLETVPLTPEGTVYNNISYTIGYQPVFLSLGAIRSESYSGFGAENAFGSGSEVVQMPDSATNALIYVFSSTELRANYGVASDGQITAFRGYFGTRISLENATYLAGETAVQGFAMYHNLTIPYNSSTVERRASILPTTKINAIQFTPGSAVTFNFQQELIATGASRVVGGAVRIIVIPYKQADDTPVNTGATEISPGLYFDGSSYFSNNSSLLDEIVDPETPEQVEGNASAYLKVQITAAFDKIAESYPYVSASVQAQLDVIKQGLYDVRNLPGTPEEVGAVVFDLIQQMEILIGYKFRFES